MPRAPKILLAVQLPALAFLLAGCQSQIRPWTPPEELKVMLVSDALFIRTSEGDYVDGYLAEYESSFRKERMFMVLTLPHFLKGDRLVMEGTPTEATVRIALDGRIYDRIRIYVVQRASPNVPSAPNIPTLK